MARARHGPYLVFIDADVCIHQDTLLRFAERFTADPTLDAVMGSYDDAPAASNFLSQYKNLFTTTSTKPARARAAPSGAAVAHTVRGLPCVRWLRCAALPPSGHRRYRAGHLVSRPGIGLS